MKFSIRFAVCILLAFVSSVCQSFGQQITGAVTGTVTDPAGAPVSAAQVKLTNNGTSAVANTTSDAAGNFQFLLLPPGNYSLQVSNAGFKSFVREGIVVEVDRSLAVPVSLQLGQVSETIEVQGGADLLEPNTSSLGTVMEEKKVVDLPLNGRNPMGLANLIPTVKGIGYFGGQVLSSWRLAAVSIGGGQPLTNGFLVDGIANDKMVDSGPMTFLTVDSTQEFKVQTNGMSAEFGRTSGGVISMITKSGTNTFHGSLFEFLRNEDLNANDFFANKAGRAIAPDKVNQFGGTFAGPLKRDKLFFFYNYEGYRERSASIETITSPTAAQRTGDFSGLRTSAGAPILIFDPNTTRPDPANPGRFIRDQFPGNVIPENRISSVGANILKYYPSPNLPGLSANLFLQGATPIDKDTQTVRIDYNLSANRRIAGRYTYDGLNWQFANFFGNIADVDGRKIWIPRKSAFLSYTDSLSPTMLFDARVGFNHQVEAYNTPSQGFDITQLGMPQSLLAQSQAAPTSSKQGTFPRVAVSDLIPAFGGINAAANHTNTGSASATVTKIHGGQTWKFGYEYRLYQRNEFTLNYPVGFYTFNRQFTQGPSPDAASATSGYSVASLLLGIPSSGTGGINAASAITLKYNSLFFQDDWKLSRKLTLNLGLRWDKEGSPTERYNIFANFDPSAPSLQVPGLNLHGGLSFPGAGGRDSGFFASSNTNFQPRIGLAFQANQKTVVRAAYGISYVPTTQGMYTTSQLGFSSTTPMVTSNDGGLTPANTLSNPFPAGLIAPTGATLGSLTAVGTNISAAVYNPGRGYAQQWNFTIQHQPFENWLFEAGYVGNRGIHLFMYNENLNWLPDRVANSYGASLATSVSNPFYGIIKSGPLSATTVPQAQLLLPYPQFTALSGTIQGGVVNPFSYRGDSIYHALTAKVEKRFSKGLSILAAYSKSKLIDVGDNLTQVRPGGITGALVQDWSNLRAERSKSLYDVPQRLVLTTLYELPFAKNGNRALRAVAGGWQVNGIMTIQSGLPIPIQMPANTFGADRPSVVPGASDQASRQSLSQWFNTQAFTAPAAYTYGTVGRTLPDVSGDGLFNLDFSLFKNFLLRERYKFAFRAEAFNLTNTPTFEIPNPTYNTPTFGQVTATAFFPKPRVVQFGLRMDF
jgi:outer membrane receptor protein involved in Fe transport